VTVSNEPHAKRCGRLKNGAPGGDPSTAPRCGARTRAGTACRQPAMPNGRCRLHGGRSSGPRTEAGRRRIGAAHVTHGWWTAEGLALRRAVAEFIAQSRLLRYLANPRRTKGNRPQVTEVRIQSKPNTSL
jgi:hypothetical protein